MPLEILITFRYQISRDLSKINSAICGHQWFLKRVSIIFLKPHISTIFIAIDHDEKKNYEVSVWYGIKSRLQILKDFSAVVFNKQKRKHGKSITYLFNAKNICVLLLSQDGKTDV